MHASICVALVVFVGSGAIAQKPSPSASPGETRALSFLNPTPILGLPEGAARQRTQCSTDGLTYFAISSDATDRSALDLYSVSTGAEVKRFRRNAASQLSGISVRDFFPSEHTLVSLLEHDVPDERDPGGPPREEHYSLSISDHAGDESEAVPLNLSFKPLRIAVFGSGEYLALGWEEANQLPELAVLKADGTPRRFIDFDDRSRSRGTSPAVAPGETRDTEESLRKAALVPFGTAVLLTYPGTTRPVRVLTSAGFDRQIPISLPAGFLLKDVLVSGTMTVFFVRATSTEEVEPVAAGEAKTRPVQRIFEVSAADGKRLREFTFPKQDVADVTCAANNSFTAVFLAPVGSPVPSGTATNGAMDPMTGATQLVVSTVRR
jgi:hypothetical protein